MSLSSETLPSSPSQNLETTPPFPRSVLDPRELPRSVLDPRELWRLRLHYRAAEIEPIVGSWFTKHKPEWAAVQRIGDFDDFAHNVYMALWKYPPSNSSLQLTTVVYQQCFWTYSAYVSERNGLYAVRYIPAADLSENEQQALDSPEIAGEAVSEVMRRERREILEAALGRLRPAWRDIVKEYHGWDGPAVPISEIAKREGCSRQNIDLKYQKALERLMGLLEGKIQNDYDD